ncbi:MAG: nitrous oxide reductase family maturation protein NosD [Candidatus Eisenbacteria bacterium]
MLVRICGFARSGVAPFAAAVVAVLIIAGGTARASTLRVPSQYGTIQQAIATAQQGDTVLIAPGTYTGTGNRDISLAGKAIVVRSEQGAEVTILDVEGTPELGHRGFHISAGEGPSTVIEGLTIRGGYEPGTGGAGIFCDYTSPTIRDCVVADNFVSLTGEDGGGILLWSSNSLIEGCTIRGNTASYGGGIACRLGSSPTIRDCRIYENSGGYGGGIDCGGTGAPRIVDCDIRGNDARNGLDDSGWGGGLLLGGDAVVTGCVVAGNVSGLGAGITSYGGHNLVERTTIAGNDAWIWQGGGIVSMNSSLTIVGCVVAGNCAAVGPSILASYGTIHLSCSVADSQAVSISGGEIFDEGGNRFEDPHFCGPALCTDAPTLDGDYTVSRQSACFPDLSACQSWVGALGAGCPAAAIPPDGSEEASGRRLLLAPPWPNPSPGEVQLTLALPEAERVRLRIVTAEGKIAATLVNRELAAGAHTFRWQAGGEGVSPRLPGGVYFVQLFLPGSGIEESRAVVLLPR